MREQKEQILIGAGNQKIIQISHLKKQIKAMLTSVTNVASEHRKVPGIGVWGDNLVCRNICLTNIRT